MLGDDEDVFDSVTWESSATHAFDFDGNVPTGPGFRQSTADTDLGPLDPKWEGYLITSVKDPVKELAETKDAYVSYLVQARVRYFILQWPFCDLLPDKPPDFLYSKSHFSKALPRLCFSQGKPCKGLSSLCCPSVARQAPARFVSHLQGQA
jgi:sorting nexin-4